MDKSPYEIVLTKNTKTLNKKKRPNESLNIKVPKTRIGSPNKHCQK